MTRPASTAPVVAAFPAVLLPGGGTNGVGLGCGLPLVLLKSGSPLPGNWAGGRPPSALDGRSPSLFFLNKAQPVGPRQTRPARIRQAAARTKALAFVSAGATSRGGGT